MARPGQDGAGTASDAEGREGVEAGASSRRLTVDFSELDLLDQMEQAGQTGSLDKETFLQLCAEQPERLFNGLYDHMSKLEEQLREAAERNLDDDLEEENQQLKERVKNQRDAMAELIIERDEARDQLEQHQDGATAHVSSSKKKSTKLPDGQHLTDGADPKFESWLIDVENKLEANADHYPTPLARMQYVKSMCKGEAANHLLPRFRKDSPVRYRDVDDIIDHLKTLYLDENRVINAKVQLRRLFMRDMKFQTFLSQFALYAQESELATSSWKDELYEKLSPEMQRHMVKESYDSTMSYARFVQECHKTANRLEQIAEVEKRTRPRGNKGNNNTSVDGKKDPHTGAKGKDAGGKDKISWAEKKQLMEEKKCFICKMPGHIASDCDFKDKGKAPDLKALEPAKKNTAEDSSNSENDSA
jgi:hypothetical protein